MPFLIDIEEEDTAYMSFVHDEGNNRVDVYVGGTHRGYFYPDQDNGGEVTFFSVNTPVVNAPA